MKFDIIDQEILAKRISNRNKREGFSIGDFVEFSDGTIRRFSHIWDDGPQTSDDGSFYLMDNGNGSFSGSLHGTIKKETLALTEEVKMGRFWIFHHNEQKAFNGVDVFIPCKVYRCSEKAN